MPTRHRQCHRWLVILLVALLSPIMPGKVNLCLLPGGEMHLEADCATPCSQAASPTQAGDGHEDRFCRLNDGEGACLDFTVGEKSASRLQNRNLAPLSPVAFLILPSPVIGPATGQTVSRDFPPLPHPHLVAQQTTVIRI